MSPLFLFSFVCIIVQKDLVLTFLAGYPILFIQQYINKGFANSFHREKFWFDGFLKFHKCIISNEGR